MVATRTGYAGTQSVGDVLTSANFTKLPNGLIAYATTTSSNTGISTVTDLLTITFTAPGSRLYRITGHVGSLEQKTAIGLTKAFIRNTGSTVLGTIFQRYMDPAIGAAGERNSVGDGILDTPSAGSITYRLSLQTSAGTVDAGANSADPGPMLITVEDLGPSF